MRTIMQEARKLARSNLFGDARENAKLVFALEDEMKNHGRAVKIVTTSKVKALNRLKIIMTSKVKAKPIEDTSVE